MARVCDGHARGVAITSGFCICAGDPTRRGYVVTSMGRTMPASKCAGK